jgi:diaminopimelate decarboxylase
MVDTVARRFDALASVLTTTDSLTSDDDGLLHIEGSDVRSLVERFGSPLYVVSERTFRLNVRRLRRELAARWPQPTRVLYAIKANNNLALRAIANEEGAGGDCFGLGELHATFAGGADPEMIVLNGSSKSDAELKRAVELGLTVNVDAEDELERLDVLASAAGRRIRINLRLKVAPPALDALAPADGGMSVTEEVLSAQWGLSIPLAACLVPIALSSPGLDLRGYHIHIGRVTNDPRFYRVWAEGAADAVAELHKHTGFAPSLLDMGGGYARERDPESRTLDLNPHPVEEYLDAVTGGLQEGLTRAGIALPELWIEPGRYIAGNSAVLLGTVGSVKQDLERTWVHVDCSVNNLLRIDLMGVKHHVLAAEHLRVEPTIRADIVGPLCAGSPIAAGRQFPFLRRGDIVAVLDAGMYAEIFTARYNGVPLPATVLVNGNEAEVIKEREAVDDVFARHRVPERLRKSAGLPVW